mgnify:FL=1
MPITTLEYPGSFQKYMSSPEINTPQRILVNLLIKAYSSILPIMKRVDKDSFERHGIISEYVDKACFELSFQKVKNHKESRLNRN